MLSSLEESPECKGRKDEEARCSLCPRTALVLSLALLYSSGPGAVAPDTVLCSEAVVMPGQGPVPPPRLLNPAVWGTEQTQAALAWRLAL